MRCYLHARTYFTLADTTSIPMCAMYLHARMFCTLDHMSSIPMGAMYLCMKNVLYTHSYDFYTCGCNVFTCSMFCTLSDTILYPLQGPIFPLITEVWPHANQTVVTNNSTVIIKVVFLRGSCMLQHILKHSRHIYSILNNKFYNINLNRNK